jgi:diacylglycerol diphosphate phosphatase/phosphatidate phosphatase
MYGSGPVELSNAVFTRKAGWGFDEGAFGGAPGDASGATGGVGGGYSNGTRGIMSGHHDNNGIAGNGHGIDRRPVGTGVSRHGDNMV